MSDYARKETDKNAAAFNCDRARLYNSAKLEWNTVVLVAVAALENSVQRNSALRRIIFVSWLVPWMGLLVLGIVVTRGGVRRNRNAVGNGTTSGFGLNCWFVEEF